MVIDHTAAAQETTNGFIFFAIGMESDWDFPHYTVCDTTFLTTVCDTT